MYNQEKRLEAFKKKFVFEAKEFASCVNRKELNRVLTE
jgi:hypothetical protein